MDGYLITYTDHRYDDQSVKATSYEDAEKIAQFLADMYGLAMLTDGELSWLFERAK